MTTRARLFLAGTAVVAVAIGALAARFDSGQAHAGYDRSVPAADSSVPAAPAMIEIVFTQEIDASGTVIYVFGPDGAEVDQGDTTLDLYDPNRERVTVSLEPDLGPGTYRVEWTSLSAEDGESDSGSFEFQVGGGSATPGASPVASPAASPEASREA